MRSFAIENRAKSTINKMCYGENTFTPQFERETGDDGENTMLVLTAEVFTFALIPC